jgi:mRNA interferase HigB
MRIIALRTLREYWETHANARESLQAWYDHVRQVDWKAPEDLARDYGQDALLPGQRAVFKIKGNQFRLVVRINYQHRLVFIRFIGTHAEYNRIDATKI